MKTATLIAFLFSISFIEVFAQEQPKKEDAQKKVADAMSAKDLKGEFKEGWNKSTQFGVNFNASGFNSGWRTVNSGVTGNTMLNFVLNHQNAKLWGKNLWVNDFQGNIGFLKPQGGNFNRNVDKLFINSMYGRKVSDKISVFAEGNFLSQFLSVKQDLQVIDQTTTPVDTTIIPNKFRSGFMNPGYLTISTGIEYRPKDFLSVKIAPIANRSTFVTNKNVLTDDNGYAYGVNVRGNKTSLNEFGTQLTVGFNKEIVKNVNLGFRYNIFQSWEKEENRFKTNGEPKWKAPDHRLDLVATAAINKYLNVNFTTILIRDIDITDGWQSATGFGAGLLATF